MDFRIADTFTASLGRLAVQRKLFAHELAEILDAFLFASPSHRSIERLAEMLEALPRRQQEFVLRMARGAAKTNTEIAYLIATLSIDALGRLDENAFQDWAIAGLDVFDKQGLRAAVETLRDIDGFLARREGRLHASFADVEQRLARFVLGLSGRPLALKPGAYPWTDTETIFLPERLAHFATAEENRRFYQGLAVQLWAQTRYGTFNADLEDALAQWPGSMEREQALTWLAHLEAVRLEACVARELPGLGALLAGLRDAWPAPLQPAIAELQAADADIACTLRWLAHFMAESAVPPAPTFVGRLEPGSAARVRAERIQRDTETLKKAIGALKGAGGTRKAAPNEFSAELNRETGEIEVRVDGEAVKLPDEAQAAAQSLMQDLGQVPPEALSPAGDAPWTPDDRTRTNEPEAINLSSTRPPDFRYDEWDYHRNAYRRGWCHVYVTDVKPGEGHFVRDTKLRYAPFIHQLKRRFEAVRGEDRILGRQPDGEEVDLDALVELHLGCAIQLVQAALPAMRHRRYGRVILLSSRAALGLATRTSYAATKAGMLGLARTWALELAADGITVNVIAPGPIRTDMFYGVVQAGSDKERQLEQSVPVRRLGEPADVARAVGFFAEPANGFVTGQVLYVCGGTSVGSLLL